MIEDGFLFRPVKTINTPARITINPEASVFKVGEYRHIHHHPKTELATVGRLETWFSHGLYNGKHSFNYWMPHLTDSRSAPSDGAIHTGEGNAKETKN